MFSTAAAQQAPQTRLHGQDPEGDVFAPGSRVETGPCYQRVGLSAVMMSPHGYVLVPCLLRHPGPVKEERRSVGSLRCSARQIAHHLTRTLTDGTSQTQPFRRPSRPFPLFLSLPTCTSESCRLFCCCVAVEDRLHFDPDNTPRSFWQRASITFMLFTTPAHSPNGPRVSRSSRRSQYINTYPRTLSLSPGRDSGSPTTDHDDGS